MILLVPVAAFAVVWLVAGLSPVQVIAELAGSVTLTPEQHAIRTYIERRAGWLGPALVVNAYAESALDPTAMGDGGASVGLWQLHENGGGQGMTVAQRQNVDASLSRILELCHAEPAITSARGTATHQDLAELVARHVERCAACGYQSGSGELWRRRRLVATLYGADLAASVPT